MDLNNSSNTAILILAFVFGAYYIWYATNKVGSSIKARLKAERAELYKKSIEDLEKWRKHNKWNND